MEEIKSCKYNTENDTIEIVRSNGSKMSILCTAGALLFTKPYPILHCNGVFLK